MEIPQIRMESQFAKIGIEQTATSLEINQPRAEMQIEQPKADLTINTVKGKLTIDQTQAWEETNIKSPRRWNEIFASEGNQAAGEGTARRAEQGAELMNIHQGSSTIAEQAITNGHPQMKTLSVGYIPSPFSVKIHYQPTEVQIAAYANQPVINATTNQPEINANRGGVEIEMKQYASLDIDFEPR